MAEAEKKSNIEYSQHFTSRPPQHVLMVSPIWLMIVPTRDWSIETIG
jgi:hypothetical protein